MATSWYESKFRILDVAIANGAGLGIKEDPENAAVVEPARTLTGKLLVFKGLWSRAWKLRVSASGNGVRWSPAVDGLVEGESLVTVYALTSLTAQIPAGQTSVVLSRPPVPGSVFAHSYETDARVAVAVDGKTVSIAAARSEPVTIKFRPALLCVFMRFNPSADEIAGTQGWTMEFEEQQAS